jgi:hypothetical protein
MTMVRLEGLRNLETFNDLTGTQTRDLPPSSIEPLNRQKYALTTNKGKCVVWKYHRSKSLSCYEPHSANRSNMKTANECMFLQSRIHVKLAQATILRLPINESPII